ncbi:MAG: hypothetical protein PHN60_00665 [Candidatus Gracilibacteria bacterium]|nr:hypothetical protein [Candidatus Gracilibacteria bacterium]
MINAFGGNCIRVTTGESERPILFGAGIMELSRNSNQAHCYTYAKIDGEFRHHTGTGLPAYTDSVRFRVADIIPLCPISKGLLCQDVEILQDEVWRKVSKHLCLHSMVEAGLSDEEMKRYRSLLLKGQKFQLADYEKLFLERVKEQSTFFLQRFKENLLYQRNREGGNAGKVELF